jgi:hypothetical protein
MNTLYCTQISFRGSVKNIFLVAVTHFVLRTKKTAIYSLERTILYGLVKHVRNEKPDYPVHQDLVILVRMHHPYSKAVTENLMPFS